MAFKKYTNGTVNNSEIHFECDCSSTEHMVKISFNFDEDDTYLYLDVLLKPERNLFKRFWKALKYLFGHRSRYGDFDEFLFKKKDVEDLRKVLLDYEAIKNNSREIN